MKKEDSVSSKDSRIAPYVLICTILLGSILQGIWFLRQHPLKWFPALAVSIAILNLVLVIRSLFWSKEGSSISNSFGLFILQTILLAVGLFSLALPPVPRILVVALILLHSAVLVSAFFALIGIVRQPKAIFLCLSFAAGIFLLETALSAPPSQKDNTGAEWIGTMQPYPGVGAVYRPGSVLQTVYPENPRKYFEEEDDRKLKWWVRVDGGNQATMILPSENPDLVRIEIQKVQTKNAFDVQLNQSHLKVVANQGYELQFQARADQPRSIFVGCAMSHDPWDGLGLYQKIDLTETIKNNVVRFSAKANDENARIHFDLGDSSIPVELTSVTLRTHPAGQAVQPQLPPTKYTVTYRFNSQGCRDREYALPRPADTQRILFLGDSYTLGVGVREQDTVARQVERLLQSASPQKKFEVINCGVSGYGTHEERLFYELFGANYQPQIVLLFMVWNDDLSFIEEFSNQYVKRSPAKLELLFHTWANIQRYRYQRPFPNFTKCVDEILRLDLELRKEKSRLGVVIFRNDPDYDGSTYHGKIWNHLTRTVVSNLQGENIPVVDLGKPLFEKYSKEELDVHPTIDHHPNEIANRIAAQEVLKFLREKLLSL